MGWFGVDLFFAISGFVITYSALLLRRAEPEGFIRAYWAGDAAEEAQVKAETGATIRAFPFDQPTEPGRCIRTGVLTTQQAIFARAY